MRNCWLAAIAGHQGDAPSNISHESPTGAEGAGGTGEPGAPPTGTPSSPAPRPGPAPRKPAGSQATTSATQRHVVSYNPGYAVPGILRRAPMPRVPVGLLAVVARAGPQVGGVRIFAVADHILVQAPVYVGVVVGDLKGRDHTVGVLLDLLGRGFWTRALVY